LARLERAGIDFHAQLVLCPGVNDGEEMNCSIRELATFKRCLSIAGVPVGLTKHGLERQSKQMRLSRTCMRLLPGKQIAVRRYEQDEAEEVIKQAERWQSHFRKDRGSTFFHLGDEFYLMTGRDVPAAEIYDGYPQIEDGIGVTRHFIENLGTYLQRSKPGGLTGADATIACATLIGPSMRSFAEKFNRHTGAKLDVAVIDNQFFGSEINISGLLTGSDLLRSIPKGDTKQPLYISSRMISDRTHTLLDDLTIADVSKELGRPVVPALTMSDVGRDLRQRYRTRRAA
jgi:NifB/MoaA-like Fe-S oxidoreductase